MSEPSDDRARDHGDIDDDLPALTEAERAVIDAGGRLRYVVMRPEVEGPNSR